jgi:hypothetical protein
MLMLETSCFKPFLRHSARLAAPLAATAALLMGPASARAQAPAPTAEPAPAAAAPGEPPAPTPPPPNFTPTTPTAPTIDLAVPPPAPPVGRSYRQHEGFYARVNVGLGSMLSATVENDAGGELETGGLTLNYDLLVGGSPAPGFSLGGGVIGGFQMSGDWESGGIEASGGDMTTLIGGPFADGFPMSNGGWHFGGLVGLAYAGLKAPGATEGSDAVGFGAAFWAGHDVWVAPEWSVGGNVRLDALRATGSETVSGSDVDYTVTEVGLTLSFSVLYN